MVYDAAMQLQTVRRGAAVLAIVGASLSLLGMLAMREAAAGWRGQGVELLRVSMLAVVVYFAVAVWRGASAGRSYLAAALPPFVLGVATPIGVLLMPACVGLCYAARRVESQRATVTVS